jgi:hypothetical protein
MKLILTNTNLNFTLQKNARSVICERYERSMVWDAILKEYIELIKTHNV